MEKGVVIEPVLKFYQLVEYIHHTWFGVLYINPAQIDMIMEDLSIHIGNSFRIK